MRYLLPLLVLSCSPSPKLCADACSGCCVGETCEPGGIDNGCGSHGTACVDCTKAGDHCAVAAGVTSCHPSGAGGGSAVGGGSASGGGAGTGGGVADPMVSVEVRYGYIPTPDCSTNCSGSPPPLAQCDFTGHLPQSQWLGSVEAQMQQKCTVTGSGTTFTADCDAGCMFHQDVACAGDGGHEFCWSSCNPPYGGSMSACAWSP